MPLVQPGSGRAVLVAGVVLLVALVGAYAVLEAIPLSLPLRLLVAAAPLAAFGYFIATEVRTIRSTDELQQRIQLEALALAYPAAIMLIYALGLLERVGVLVPGFSSLRDVWPLAILPYFVGIVLAYRRYR
jgi:hypothetical protein